MKKAVENLKGIYLVIDPSIPEEQLLAKLKAALEGGVSLVQIWNNWQENPDLEAKIGLIDKVSTITEKYQVPLLINEEWKLVEKTALNGVHFDAIPPDFQTIQADFDNDIIIGITCSNNLEIIKWAEENACDYISFCAMYSSASVSSCEIVSLETIKKAREITSKPIFLSGGIDPEKIKNFKDLNIQGVAVISGIMSAGAPEKETQKYTKALKNIQQ